MSSFVRIEFDSVLLGSEKVKVSLSKGKQLVETNNINKSLLTLGSLIAVLILSRA